MSALLHLHVVAHGIDERMSVPIDRPLALGRDVECDVALPSATVSRRHLSLFVREGRLLVRDHSSNGTRVNGERLHLAVRELEGKAALEVGPYSIGLQLAEEGAAAEARGASTLELPCESTPALGAIEALAREPRVVTTPGPVPAHAVALATPVPAAMGHALGPAPASGSVPPLDPLAVLLTDPEVSEVVLVDELRLVALRAGQYVSAGAFVDEAAATSALARLLERGRLTHAVAESVLEVALPDGFMLHAVLPPLAQGGPRLHLRRIGEAPSALTALVDAEVCSPAVASLLGGAVRARRNVLVVGPRRRDRVTMLSALCGAIPTKERVLCITRDGRSLAPAACETITLRRGPAPESDVRAQEGDPLLRMASAFEPAYLVLDECTVIDTAAWTSAMREHGCLSQLAASCPREALAAFEHARSRAHGRSSRALLHEQLAATGLLFVQMGRANERALRVLRVCELEPQPERGFALRECFRYEQRREDDARGAP